MVTDLLVIERLPAHLEELELNSFAVLKDVEYVVYTAQYICFHHSIYAFIGKESIYNSMTWTVDDIISFSQRRYKIYSLIQGVSSLRSLTPFSLHLHETAD